MNGGRGGGKEDKSQNSNQVYSKLKDLKVFRKVTNSEKSLILFQFDIILQNKDVKARI
jgi:hypothetical protein